MTSNTETLISALRQLSKDIYSEDGVANAAIAEAADRLSDLHNSIQGLCEHFGAEGIADLGVKLLRLERARAEARKALDDIAEYGIEEINAAVDLRSELAAALVERDEARELAEKWRKESNWIGNETGYRLPWE